MNSEQRPKTTMTKPDKVEALKAMKDLIDRMELHLSLQAEAEVFRNLTPESFLGLAKKAVDEHLSKVKVSTTDDGRKVYELELTQHVLIPCSARAVRVNRTGPAVIAFSGRERAERGGLATVLRGLELGSKGQIREQPGGPTPIDAALSAIVVAHHVLPTVPLDKLTDGFYTLVQASKAVL